MEFYDVLRTRRSMRGYKPDPVPEAALDAIKEAIRLAPSGCNLQPVRFIFIKNEELRKKIAAYYPFGWLDQPPVLIAAVGNADMAWHRMDGDHESIIELDIGIAMEHVQLAATAEGLNSCWIGAIPRKEVNELLNVEAPWSVIALSALGYGAKNPAARPNKPDNELFEDID